MTWYVWIGFVAASLVVGVMPGPGVMSIIGYAMSSGRRVALASVAGMAVGNGVAMTLSLLGVGTLLATSALAFATVKAIGAIYLVGLGIWTIVRSGPTTSISRPPPHPRSAFLGNVAVGTFHPKTIVFFVAYVPQFIRADSSFAAQAAILIVTFCTVVGATDSVYALAAARAARLLRTPRAATWLQRTGGGVLIGSGVATARS